MPARNNNNKSKLMRNILLLQHTQQLGIYLTKIDSRFVFYLAA